MVSQTPFSRRFKPLARQAAAPALLGTTAGVQIAVRCGGQTDSRRKDVRRIPPPGSAPYSTSREKGFT